jgi:hypothetical protein
VTAANDPVRSDAPSRKYRQYTLAGIAIDLNAEGGGPCRGMMLMNTATGTLTTTPANPITGDEGLLVTNLPAGTPLPIVATAIAASSPVGLIVSVYW